MRDLLETKYGYQNLVQNEYKMVDGQNLRKALETLNDSDLVNMNSRDYWR